MDAEDEPWTSFLSHASTVSITETEIEVACRKHAGVFTRRMLEDGRRVRMVEQEATTEEVSPRKRRFYAMTVDDQGQEKALDGLWIDKLQEMIDEANRAYGGKNDWHDQIRSQEQNELKTQIHNNFTNFSQCGSESIDSVMDKLSQVWKTLSSEKEIDVPSDLGDLKGSLEGVHQLLKDARDKGCGYAERVTRQWFAYVSKEVFNVERFGSIEIKDLEGLKHRLNLLRMHDELNERWHRMDALNAGLEEAVRSKSSLQASVESAELLLIKQVEAEYKKSFERETRQMVMRAAKQRAETAAQVESCLRYRFALRSELLRILTELWDKLRQWHEKLCKKYSEAIRQLKSGKRKMEEHLRSAEQKLRFIEEKKATTQNALASLLKPYAGAGIAGSNLDPYGDLPKRDELVVKIYALVAALEEPMVSPIIFDAVQQLISRSPHEKMERLVENLTPTKEGQREQRVLDFAGVQQLLQYTSAARANEDLAPFLASNKSTPLLLRGPDQVRLAEILKEYREALVDRNSHASAKLLIAAEPFLKLLSKVKEEQQNDSVAAEVGLVLAMANFGAMTRVQRGCQLMAAILNLRSLQLRKHALTRILSEPFPGPSSEDMNGQVRSIDAMYRSIEGGVGVLRNQAQSFARDAGNLMKVYGKEIDDLIQVTKRLAPRVNQGQGSGRRMSQDADGCVDSSARRKQDSVVHLPALLAYQKGSENPTDIMIILKYQKILLKLQLQMRKWLRSTCSPNLPQDELSQTEDALQVMQKFISKRHPDYQESVHDSAPSESSADGPFVPGSPKRRSASVDVGNVSVTGVTVGDWEREISQASRPSEGEKTEGEDAEVGTASGPPKWRRWSDILHDRPNQAQVVQLASAFQEHLQKSRTLVDESSSSSEQLEVSVEVVEESPRMKEIRSKATFLNWASGRPTSTQKKGRMKGLALAKKPGKPLKPQKPQKPPAPKLEPEDPSRVYMDLMGRHVLQEFEASEVQSEASEVSEYSESDDDQMHSPIASQRILLEAEAVEAVEVPRVFPQRDSQKPARTRTSSDEEVTFSLQVGDGHTSPKPGRLGVLSPTGEVKRTWGRLVSPTVQAETSEFRLEGVSVRQRQAKRKASAEIKDDVSATSSEEVPEEVSQPQEIGFSRMRTPTLVSDGFLLVDDAAADKKEYEEDEVRDDSETDEAAKKPQTDHLHLHLRQPSRDASPGSKSSHSLRSHSRRSHSSAREDDSPEARSAETSHWLLEVLEGERGERQSSLKSMVPRTGRAFPSSSNEYTCAGPPGTARRLRLHQRPTSQPAKPVEEELEEEPVVEEVRSWRCLPKEPGGDWKLLAGSPRDEEMQAAPAPRMATTSTEEAEANQMQVVRISSMEFPLQRPGAAAIMNQRGKRCLGRARVLVSRSNCELQPSPSDSSNASDVETLEDDVGSDAALYAASTPDRQITPEAATSTAERPQPEAAERPQDREPMQHRGPLRKHLPMTRRGVVPLLTPHEVDELEVEQLELLGEAVRNSRNPRTRHLVSGFSVFSGLSTSKPSNPSPGDVVGGAREAAVGVMPQRHAEVILPVETGVKADFDMDCPTGFRTRECVPAAEQNGAEGLVSDPSVPSIPQSRVTLPPRHGVTLEGDAMEEIAADLQHFFHDTDECGSMRPGSQPTVSLSDFARQAVAAAAGTESPSRLSEPSGPGPSGPSQRASEWSNVESEVVKAGVPPVSSETPRRSKRSKEDSAKGSSPSIHKTRAPRALRDREGPPGVRQRPLSELVASDRPVVPAPSRSSGAVEAQLNARGKQMRPPFGSNVPRN